MALVHGQDKRFLYFYRMSVSRVLAHTISLVFHPLGVLSYTLLFLLWTNPYVFGVHHLSQRLDLLLIVVSTSFFLPALAVLLMVRLQLVGDLQVRNRLQRIGPYIAAGVFYSWLTINLLRNTEIPFVFGAVALGCTLAIFLAFVVNVLFKVSLHAIGAAGMIAIFVILHLTYPYAHVNIDVPGWGTLQISLLTMVFVSILIAGFVGTSRMLLGVHQPSEIYSGYVIGFITPFLGWQLADIL